jgi:hypothetical protein
MGADLAVSLDIYFFLKKLCRVGLLKYIRLSRPPGRAPLFLRGKKGGMSQGERR